MSADGSVHMVDRRAKLNVDAPYLLKKMMGVEFLLFRQRNTKDLRARELRIEAWNESFDTRVEINEYCVYRYINMNPFLLRNNFFPEVISFQKFISRFGVKYNEM